MPSNQYRPLTKATSRGGIVVYRNLVPLINRALTFCSAAYIGVSIIFSLIPSSSDQIESICNPFILPGYISQLPSGLSTYRTYDQSCNSPGLLPTLLSLLASSPYYSVAVPPRNTLSQKDVTDRISNKTALMIGDTVDDAFVEHFCKLIGRTVDEVDQRHPWGGAWTKIPEQHLKVAGSNTIANGNPGEKILSHYCYMPEFDFLITSVNHLGTDVADTFHSAPAWTAPTLFESRVSTIYAQYIKDLALSHPAAPSIPPPRLRSQPDLVIFSTSFWDLARYAQEDSMQLRSLVDDLTEHRLLEWRGRNVDMLHSIRKIWPDSKIAWRSLHAPGDTEKATVEWWTGSEKEGFNSMNPHPLFHLNRIAQLNSARKSVLYPTGDDIVKGVLNRSSRLPSNINDFDIANILLGQDHHQTHPINPSLDPAGSIFAEMLLNAM